MVQDLGAADTVLLAGQSVDRATLQGLKAASLKSGVSFRYLLAKAAQESGLNPDAQAETSSAAGLFQFTRGTWLDMVKRYGSQFGFADLARQILETPSGKLTVTDAAAEKRILALRDDPETAALMAAEYARDNAIMLKDALGRDPGVTDLYLAHFLGATGAASLLNAAATDPTRDAAAIVPAAAKANPSVFQTPQGEARSAAEVVRLISDRFTSQFNRYAAADTVATDAAAPAISQPSPRVSPSVQSDLQQALGNLGNAPQSPVSMLILDQLIHLIAAAPLFPADASNNQAGAVQPLGPATMNSSDWADEITRSLIPTPSAAPTAARVYNGPAPGPSKLDDLL